MIVRVRELGFEVADDSLENEPSPEMEGSNNFLQYMWQRPDTRLILLGALLILPGLLLEELFAIHHLMINLASIGALISAGLPVARSAWRAISINREININVLMTIAAIGAVVIGAYTEAGMVMVLFAFGETLEGLHL